MADDHNHTEVKTKKSFWDTTIGFITKIAAFLTAITTLVIAIRNFSGDVLQPVKNTTPETSTSDEGINPPVTDPPPSIGTEVSATPPVQTIVEEKSEITFASFDIQPSNVVIDTNNYKPKPITATIELVNTGNVLMTNCRISIITDKGYLTDGVSGYFSLSPGERKTIPIVAGIAEPGNVIAMLESNDYKVQSFPFKVDVTFKGFIHNRPGSLQ